MKSKAHLLLELPAGGRLPPADEEAGCRFIACLRVSAAGSARAARFAAFSFVFIKLLSARSPISAS